MDSIRSVTPYLVMLGGVAVFLTTFFAKEYAKVQKRHPRLLKTLGGIFAAAMIIEGFFSVWDNSSPYLLPRFDTDKILIFAHNDGNQSAHITYREFVATAYLVDGTSDTVKHVLEAPLEIPRKNKRWLIDLLYHPQLVSYRLSLVGQARNGDFSSGIELDKYNGGWNCKRLYGKGRNKLVCP